MIIHDDDDDDDHDDEHDDDDDDDDNDDDDDAHGDGDVDVAIAGQCHCHYHCVVSLRLSPRSWQFLASRPHRGRLLVFATPCDTTQRSHRKTKPSNGGNIVV